MNIASAWESQLLSEENKTIKNSQVIAGHGNKGNQNHMVGTEENNFILGPEAVTEVQHNIKTCT